MVLDWMAVEASMTQHGALNAVLDVFGVICGTFAHRAFVYPSSSRTVECDSLHLIYG